MKFKKFRAYDVNCHWTYFELSPKVLLKGVPEPLKSIIKQEEGYKLMESYDLFDTNGREIYEGDVCQDLQCSPSLGNLRVMENMVEDMSWLKFNTLEQENNVVVIIGNIHDNPELLKNIK
jgi:YopX protein